MSKGTSRHSPTSPEDSAAQATTRTQLANIMKKLRTKMSANTSPVQVSSERPKLPAPRASCASPGSNCAASSAGSPSRAAVSSSD